MKNELLLAPFSKIERGKAQIHDLSEKVGSFFSGRPYEVASDLDTERDEQVWRFKIIRGLPREFPVVIGEILHNLRSSLDQLACAVALDHRGSTKGTYFPFGKTAEIFELELARKGKKLPSDALDMIRSLKPYKGGNDLLWNLHDLNRRDKHIDIVPINLRTWASRASQLVMRKGLALVIGPKCGQHLIVQRKSAEEIARMSSPTAIYTLGNDPNIAQIIFGTAGCSAEKSMEFLTTTPGAQFETNMQPSFDIAFRDVPGLELEPVVAVLNNMRALAERILLAFENRFFA